MIERSVVSSGLVDEFHRAGLCDLAGVHISRTLCMLLNQTNELVQLGLALCTQAAQHGSTCLPLNDDYDLNALLAHDDDPELAKYRKQVKWPNFDDWIETLAASGLVSTNVADEPNSNLMRLIDRKLYLERNWVDQKNVAEILASHITQAHPVVDGAKLTAFINQHSSDTQHSSEQIAAALGAITNWISIVAGGPGTGKTTTVELILSGLAQVLNPQLRIALAAFSGKAAARLNEALKNVPDTLQLDRGVTLHHLLGARGTSGEFSYGLANPLPHDVVIVDEVSMVSLAMMSKLLAAIRPGTRLILLGDPDQLSSIEVGTVLADIVEASLDVKNPIVYRLTKNFRNDGEISALAQAIKAGDVNAAIAAIKKGKSNVDFVDADPALLTLDDLTQLCEEITTSYKAIYRAAANGDAEKALIALDKHRLLCAHSIGPYGVANWTRQIENLLRASLNQEGFDSSEWHVGRPLLITENSRDLGVYNGDTGVVIQSGNKLLAAIGTAYEYKTISPYLLESAQTMHALTVHKSQGSQYEHLTLILPPVGSPLLTRELLYTAATRAKTRLRIVGTEQSLITAILTPARRASGLSAQIEQEWKKS